MRYHMRRSDKEITDPVDLRKILKSTQYVTLAMSKDDRPYLVSLSHGYDEERDCIYFHCAPEGKKLDYLSSNKAVWGQALLDHGYQRSDNPCECNHLYASVHFSGRVTFLEDAGEKRRALECMFRQIDSDPEPLLERLSHDRLSRAAVGRIDIEFMTGKKSKEVTL